MFTRAVLAQAGLALENARLVELLSSGKREWEQTVDAFNQAIRSEEHTSELQSLAYLVCRLLLEKKISAWSPRAPRPRKTSRAQAPPTPSLRRTRSSPN